MTSPLTAWPLGPTHLSFDKNKVDIWRAALDQTTPVIHALSLTLSPDERERAAKYQFQKDRKHFVVARGVLRNILSRYLNIESAQLHFCYDAYGKPALSETCGTSSLRFNISHAHGLALYAFAFNRAVGIDIEYIREDIALEQIAAQFFSPREVAILRALPENEKRRGFFNCWTRKEAYIKAMGHGLSMPLDQFVVSLAPSEPAALLSVIDNPQEALRWSIKELTLDAAYVAAVAVEGHDWQPHYWQWEFGNS